MSELIIRAHDGVGPLRFGMTREEVRAQLAGLPLRSQEHEEDYLGTGLSRPARDIFPTLRLRVEYANGRCCAIELAQPAVPVFDGQSLMQTPVGALRAWLGGRDAALREDDAGFTSEALGVGIYAPGWRQDAQALPEGVIAFQRGYYSQAR